MGTLGTEYYSVPEPTLQPGPRAPCTPSHREPYWFFFSRSKKPDVGWFFFSAVWIFLFFYQSVEVAMQMRFIRTYNATEEQLFLASRTILSVVSHPCPSAHVSLFLIKKCQTAIHKRYESIVC